MRKLARELECLTQLQSKTMGLEDILAYLKEENLIDDVQIKATRSGSDLPKEMQKLLFKLKKENKIQLLEYQWDLLPVERISILIVTDRSQREFRYDEK
jgi:hypothetical protein